MLRVFMLFIFQSMLTLVYTSMMNRSLTNVTLPMDKVYVILGDLDLNNEYEMMLIANQKILFDVADFTLDGRGTCYFVIYL